MLIGKYYHKVEQRGRISLPKPFRAHTQEWVVTRGLDGGLFLFSQAEFDTQVASVATSSFTKKTIRDFTRLMANEAAAVQPDKSGRILIPDYLLAAAHIEKEVVLVGSVSRVELWDRETYHTYLDTIAASAETIAESIDVQS